MHRVVRAVAAFTASTGFWDGSAETCVCDCASFMSLSRASGDDEPGCTTHRPGNSHA